VSAILKNLPRDFWKRLGKCRAYDISMFFSTEPRTIQAAKKICSECPVRSKCLEYSLDEGVDFGVWGGKSEKERRIMAGRYRKRSQLLTS
jgi:WhiB family transcriptional regulator, redox-sensing transcriptional regulator